MKEKCSSCETLHVKYNSNTSPHLSGIPGFNLLSLQKKKKIGCFPENNDELFTSLLSYELFTDLYL